MNLVIKVSQLVLGVFLLLSVQAYALPEVGLTAKADGVIVTVLADKKSIIDILPYGIELVSAPGIPADLHPIIIFVGQHRGLSTVSKTGKEMTVVSGLYNEVTYGVPLVRAYGMSKVYTHLVTLLLDSARAIVGGRLYGFPKLPANFYANKNSITATKPFTDSKLISVQISKILKYDKVEMKKNFAAVRASITPLIVDIMGSYKCIDFNWNFDSADITPANVNLTVFSHMSRTVEGDFVAVGLDKSPLGAFQIRTQWEMSAPYKCE